MDSNDASMAALAYFRSIGYYEGMTLNNIALCELDPMKECWKIEAITPLTSRKLTVHVATQSGMIWGFSALQM